MIRIGFLLNFPKEYKGGINYFKNLFYALSKVEKREFQIFLFLPDDIDKEYIEMFSPYVTIVITSLLKRGNPFWFADKVSGKLLNYMPFTIRLLKQYKIDIVSHSNFYSRFSSFKIINWIPDFQWVHYPDLWSKRGISNLRLMTRKVLQYSDAIVVSSQDAKKDLLTFDDADKSNIQVLQFVSQPNHNKEGNLEELRRHVEKEYNFSGSFFFLPNQFWRHKNHLIAFKAIKEMKKKGLNPLLITTGLMHDFRNRNEHIDSLMKYVKDEQLQDNIRFLGLIPYRHVLFLMENCLAVINPSLFEGWSSTVEEAKSIGKLTVLSDIPVHREQNPSGAIYFNPFDEHDLANALANIWQNKADLPVVDAGKVNEDLENRTRLFAERYTDIVNGVKS